MYANMERQNKLIVLIQIVDSIYYTPVNQLLPVALLPTVQLNIDY